MLLDVIDDRAEICYGSCPFQCHFMETYHFNGAENNVAVGLPCNAIKLPVGVLVAENLTKPVFCHADPESENIKNEKSVQPSNKKCNPVWQDVNYPCDAAQGIILGNLFYQKHHGNLPRLTKFSKGLCCIVIAPTGHTS